MALRGILWRKINDSIERRLKNSDLVINKLDERWSLFKAKGTYLVSESESDFRNMIESGKRKTKIPWYFFWNSKLRNNIEKLDMLNGEILNYNHEFIKRRKLEYRALFKKDRLMLDDNQQTAIVTDDKHNLVAAGAGSGKTEVLITRIAYISKREPDKIGQDKILALAYQNKAVLEVKERLKRRYDIEVNVSTFHALGKKICNENNSNELRVIDEKKRKTLVKTLFDHEVSNNEEFQNKVIYFLTCYRDDLLKHELDFEKKEEFYRYQRNLIYTALDGTKVKSESEKSILNFFIMHNINGKKINIIYEHPAEWMKYRTKHGGEYIPKPDFYFKDFDIYLEHWAIDKLGKVPDWFPSKDGKTPTETYKETMSIKKKSFKQNNKPLIETTQAEFQSAGFYKKLEDRFLEILRKKYPDKEYKLTRVPYNDLVEKIYDDCKSVNQTVPSKISDYICIAKTYGFYPSDIEKRLVVEKWSQDAKAFAELALMMFKKYETEKGESLDYEDMINKAVKILRENENFYKDRYDHILIDEYQDISTQRFELIKELMRKSPDCKLFCVGDDWQSIMGFAGSNLKLFTNFSKYFGSPVRTDLSINYRSIKSIVEVGVNIIKNNKDSQIEKVAVSYNNKTKPLLLYSSLHGKEFKNQYYRQIAGHCFNKINEYLKNGYRFDEFMILLRISNNPELISIIKNYSEELHIPISDGPEKRNCVRILSVHKSKGLQSRVVIILNVVEGLYGFPCGLENPKIFATAINGNYTPKEEEERRLFYVAVTRAKEEVIIYTQKCSESRFISEINDFVKREDLRF